MTGRRPCCSITGEFENGVISLEYADGSEVSVLLSKRKRRVVFDGDLGVRAEIAIDASVQKKSAEISPEDMDAWLTGELTGILVSKMQELFGRLRGWDSDAMRFGTEFVKRFTSAEAWESFDKKEWLESIEPVFSVTVNNTDKYISEEMQ